MSKIKFIIHIYTGYYKALFVLRFLVEWVHRHDPCRGLSAVRGGPVSLYNPPRTEVHPRQRKIAVFI